MLRTVSALATLAILLVTGGDKAVITLKGEVGKSATYKYEGKSEGNDGVKNTVYQAMEVSEVKVEKVLEDGSIVYNQTSKEVKLNFDGEEINGLEGTEGEQGAIYTLKSDGTLKEYKDKDKSAEEDDVKLACRYLQAETPVFTKEAVGEGDTWTIEYKANKELGLPVATGKYKLLEFVTLDGIKCAKIEFKYKEDVDKGLSTVGTYWVELASGDSIKSDATMENIRMYTDEGAVFYATGKDKSQRTAGSPIGN